MSFNARPWAVSSFKLFSLSLGPSAQPRNPRWQIRGPDGDQYALGVTSLRSGTMLKRREGFRLHRNCGPGEAVALRLRHILLSHAGEYEQIATVFSRVVRETATFATQIHTGRAWFGGRGWPNVGTRTGWGDRTTPCETRLL